MSSIASVSSDASRRLISLLGRKVRYQDADGTREAFGDKAGRAPEVIKTGQSIQRSLLTPRDLVGAVTGLVSDASRFVTGQTIAIDGDTVML